MKKNREILPIIVTKQTMFEEEHLNNLYEAEYETIEELVSAGIRYGIVHSVDKNELIAQIKRYKELEMYYNPTDLIVKETPEETKLSVPLTLRSLRGFVEQFNHEKAEFMKLYDKGIPNIGMKDITTFRKILKHNNKDVLMQKLDELFIHRTGREAAKVIKALWETGILPENYNGQKLYELIEKEFGRSIGKSKSNLNEFLNNTNNPNNKSRNLEREDVLSEIAELESISLSQNA